MNFDGYYVCNRVSESELDVECLYTSVIMPGESVYPVFTYTDGQDVYHLRFDVAGDVEVSPRNIKDVLVVQLRKYDTEESRSIEDGFAVLVVADDKLLFSRHDTAMKAKLAYNRLMTSVGLTGDDSSQGRSRAGLLEL